MDKRAKIEELVKILNDASDAYYGGKDEIISNYEWDSYYDELILLENETGYILSDSPTQNVSNHNYDNKNEKRIAHEYPALSLAKTKSVEDLIKWAMDKDVNLSYKLDGLTLVLTYDNGKLTTIASRGNGIEGTDLTYLMNSLSGYPLSIKYKGHLVVRGEATISYTDFNEINELMDDDEKYANPRNLASGTLALDDPNKVKERHVTFNAFTLVHIDEEIKSWKKCMEFLVNEGFNIVEYIPCTKDTIKAALDELTYKVESGKMDIPVDGLVLCYDDNDYAKGGSVTGHHATRAGLAYKWADVSALSRLKYIEWSCAASTISPVAVFEPVQLEGTTVSRASLCNISEMERLGITDDCTVEVIKANKIIPKVISVKEATGNFVIPNVCPVCKAPTKIVTSLNSDTKTLHCENIDCSAKWVKKYARFVSKSGMDIDGLSIQTLMKFINEGFIKVYADIYHLNKFAGNIISYDGFGEKSYNNLIEAIEKSRTVKAVNFIYALNIPMIGLDAAKKIVSNLGFDGFLSYLYNGEGFDDIDGIGPEKSNSILKWYEYDKNKSDLELLLNEVNIIDGEAKTDVEGTCLGLTFVITGDVHNFKNRDEFKSYVEANGGKVAGSVSKKTNYLVNNDIESTSSKNNKAKELSVPIITEDDFIQKFGR